MLFGGRYVAKHETASMENAIEESESERRKNSGVDKTATPYPYPEHKNSKNALPFRVDSVLRSLNVNPEPILKTKTPMELHKARMRITENEIGHSLNEASKKFFGESDASIPIRQFSDRKISMLTGDLIKAAKTLQQQQQQESEKQEFEIGQGNMDKYAGKSQKLRSFALQRGQPTYPAVVLLKTNAIAPLRLNSPTPEPKYLKGKLGDNPRLEDLNVVNGFTHINTDGRNLKNTFAHADSRRPRFAKLLAGVGGRFHAEIDLNGFRDDEIFFQTDDSSLLIIGLRHKRDGLNARKVTEILQFPDGVYPESLCISRATNGLLIVEQHF